MARSCSSRGRPPRGGPPQSARLAVFVCPPPLAVRPPSSSLHRAGLGRPSRCASYCLRAHRGAPAPGSGASSSGLSCRAAPARRASVSPGRCRRARAGRGDCHPSLLHFLLGRGQAGAWPPRWPVSMLSGGILLSRQVWRRRCQPLVEAAVLASSGRFVGSRFGFPPIFRRSRPIVLLVRTYYLYVRTDLCGYVPLLCDGSEANVPLLCDENRRQCAPFMR